jgi:N-acetylglucosaminyldiphosphoundecaprenol N-acetyl-beta-D-mannosaminyltransferase
VVFAGEEWPSEDFLTKNQYKVSSIKHKGQEDIKNVEKNSLNTEYLIPNTGIGILFVAFGAPKQEFWINENLDKIPVKVAIGVGGAFDYISGKTPRAPTFIRSIGLEWLFRLVVQPWRIKRQLALIEFIWLVVKEKLSQK